MIAGVVLAAGGASRFGSPKQLAELDGVPLLQHAVDAMLAVTAIAVLTHDPKLDDAALSIALRSEAGYVGAMGSRRAQEKRRERMLALGIGDEELERLSAPIGLDLGALTPEETALSIMSEIVAHRRGREGGRLAHVRGRIHEVGA